MKRFTRIAVGFAVISSTAAICAGKDIEDSTPTPMPILSTEISGSDLGFFMGAGPQMALLERLSELAQKRAVTPEVKSEAGMVLKEQTDAAVRLKTLAAARHVPVADEPDEAGKKILQSLGKLDGVQFDKAFLNAQGDANDALEASLDAGAGSTDGEIKAFAQAELQALTAEKERVRKLGL